MLDLKIWTQCITTEKKKFDKKVIFYVQLESIRNNVHVYSLTLIISKFLYIFFSLFCFIHLLTFHTSYFQSTILRLLSIPAINE